MTAIAFVRSPKAAPVRLPARTLSLYGAVVLAAGAGILVAARQSGASDAMEWQLALLLRFMAVVKMAMVAGALGVAHWRLRDPGSAGTVLGLVAATALMAVAPGLIWSCRHIILGASCFHLGLLAYLVIAWRDGRGSWPVRRA